MVEDLEQYLNLPRHELVSRYGLDWQEKGRAVDDKLTSTERIALIPFIKRTLNHTQSIQDQVIADMAARRDFGLSKYGTMLYPHNGRNMLQDAYEEVLDLACYLKGKMEEEAHPDKQLKV